MRPTSEVKWEVTAFAGTEEQRESFVRLVKAAPDLLKALEEVYAVMLAEEDHLSQSEVLMLNRIEAAIRKAKREK